MSSLSSRWENNLLFRTMLKLKLNPEMPAPFGTRPEWFSQAPKTLHYTDQYASDFREINISNQSWGAISLVFCVLDDSLMRGCTFDHSLFQSASARHCDFTGSHFLVAQMSPIYAPEAIFKDCIFESSFLMGMGPRQEEKGYFSDLRGCDFSNVRATKSAFDWGDYRGANFSNARFEACDFYCSDLCKVNLSGTSFNHCNFVGTKFDDHPSTRLLLKTGNNLELSQVKWNPVLALCNGK